MVLLCADPLDLLTAADDALGLLTALLVRPVWQRDAACAEHAEVDFFPHRGEPTGPARIVCAGCLVRLECLAFALDGHEVGMWAGTSEKQRGHARRAGWDAERLLGEIDSRPAAR